MPRFAANLDWLYAEHAYLDRFAAAARDGFRGVELLSPYEHDAREIGARLRGEGLELVLLNSPAGDRARGERGMAIRPGAEATFRDGIERALVLAGALGGTRLHVLAGALGEGDDRDRCRATYVANLAWAAQRAASQGVTVLIEPINPRDIPGYFLNRQDEAHAIREEVGAANLSVQMDLYHCQVVEGDVANKIRRYLPGVAHMQVAGNPGRHEPDVGELHYPYLFSLVDALGYAGWIGCEYRPRGGTSEGLGWARGMLR